MNEKLVTGQYMTAVSSAYAQRLIMTLFLVSFWNLFIPCNSDLYAF